VSTGVAQTAGATLRVNCTTSHLTAYAVFAVPGSASTSTSDRSLSVGATAAIVAVAVVVVAAAVVVTAVVIRRRRKSRRIVALDDTSSQGPIPIVPTLEMPTIDKGRDVEGRMSTSSQHSVNPLTF
jgi:amino acid transporter